jgi:predicted peptidase
MIERNMIIHKTVIKVFCFIFLFALTLGLSLQPQAIIKASADTPDPIFDLYDSRIFTDAAKYGAQSLPYEIYVPHNLDPNKSYPLVLFLHGVGERAEIGISDNKKNLTYGLTHNLVSSYNLIDYPCYILAPQCPPGPDNLQTPDTGRWVNVTYTNGSYDFANTPESIPMSMTVDLINKLESQHNIDKNRLYVTGLSMGGFGTWDIIMRYPKMFAAAVPICGASDPSQAAIIKDVAIWSFHGALDSGLNAKEEPYGVPVTEERKMITALQAVKANIKYTEYPKGDHGIWGTVYDDPEVYYWMFQQTIAKGVINSEPSSKLTSAVSSSSKSISASSLPVTNIQKPSSAVTSSQKSSSSSASASSLTSSVASSKLSVAATTTKPKTSNPIVFIIIIIVIAGLIIAAAIIIDSKFSGKKK